MSTQSWISVRTTRLPNYHLVVPPQWALEARPAEGPRGAALSVFELRPAGRPARPATA